MIMWWDGLIAGLVVGTAALWLVRRAVRRIQRTSHGRGCGSNGCPSASSGTDRSVVQLRELVQVNLDVEGSQSCNVSERTMIDWPEPRLGAGLAPRPGGPPVPRPIR